MATNNEQSSQADGSGGEKMSVNTMETQFDNDCAECHKVMKKGSTIVYDPANKIGYHPDCYATLEQTDPSGSEPEDLDTHCNTCTCNNTQPEMHDLPPMDELVKMEMERHSGDTEAAKKYVAKWTLIRQSYPSHTAAVIKEIVLHKVTGLICNAYDLNNPAAVGMIDNHAKGVGRKFSGEVYTIPVKNA